MAPFWTFSGVGAQEMTVGGVGTLRCIGVVGCVGVVRYADVVGRGETGEAPKMKWVIAEKKEMMRAAILLARAATDEPAAAMVWTTREPRLEMGVAIQEKQDMLEAVVVG